MDDAAKWPQRLCLIGLPVRHSLSPAIHTAALRAAGISLDYEALEVPASDLARVAGLLREAGGAGNVTIPHKEAFVACCGELTPVARRVGAVNTFWTEDDHLVGDNTDVGGFCHAATEELRLGSVEGIEVAVLGAGGAAAAVLAGVERWGGRARVWSRTMSRAERLVARFPRFAATAWDVETCVDGAALVVNASPVGMSDDAMPVEPRLLPEAALVYDLVYRRGETPWVRACRSRGHRAADGLGMLVAQAALAFERWFGIPADRAAMRAAVS